MSLYSAEALQAKASAFLEAQAKGDDRCLFLLIVLSARTGFSPEECQACIEKLAAGEPA